MRGAMATLAAISRKTRFAGPHAEATKQGIAGNQANWGTVGPELGDLNGACARPLRFGKSAKNWGDLGVQPRDLGSEPNFVANPLPGN
jgi:hypothetical protein